MAFYSPIFSHSKIFPRTVFNILTHPIIGRNLGLVGVTSLIQLMFLSSDLWNSGSHDHLVISAFRHKIVSLWAVVQFINRNSIIIKRTNKVYHIAYCLPAPKICSIRHFKAHLPIANPFPSSQASAISPDSIDCQITRCSAFFSSILYSRVQTHKA